MEFARWLCQQLLDGYEDGSVCSVKLALLRGVNAIATWSEDDVLTLGLDTPWLWSDPLGARALSTYIHELAHHRNAHHGRDFHSELEMLAGRAAPPDAHLGAVHQTRVRLAAGIQPLNVKWLPEKAGPRPAVNIPSRACHSVLPIHRTPYFNNQGV